MLSQEKANLLNNNTNVNSLNVSKINNTLYSCVNTQLKDNEENVTLLDWNSAIVKYNGSDESVGWVLTQHQKVRN